MNIIQLIQGLVAPIINSRYKKTPEPELRGFFAAPDADYSSKL